MGCAGSHARFGSGLRHGQLFPQSSAHHEPTMPGTTPPANVATDDAHFITNACVAANLLPAATPPPPATPAPTAACAAAKAPPATEQSAPMPLAAPTTAGAAAMAPRPTPTLARESANAAAFAVLYHTASPHRLHRTILLVRRRWTANAIRRSSCETCSVFGRVVGDSGPRPWAQ